MDRVTLRRRGDGIPAEVTSDGWLLDAEHEWVLESEPTLLDAVAVKLAGVGQRLSADVLLLSFRNAVGRFDAGPAGVLRVRSGKWTEHHYAAMLTDIANWSTALPFQAGAASALPYARTELEAPDVLYHAFVWLRHALLECEDAALIGALRSILRDPHRRMITHERVVPAHQVSRVSHRSLDDVAAGHRPFKRVPAGRGLAGGTLFPVEIAEQVAVPSVDTVENRFVWAFVTSCGHILDAMRRRTASDTSAFGRRVRADCSAIEGELAPVLTHRMWEDVGPMRLFPASSTVLHRRAAYREVLRHHILIRMATKALPLDEPDVRQLLEVKDIARLYELWTAFAVIEAVRSLKGPPSEAEPIADDGLSTTLAAGLFARWPDGTEVAYNPTYTRNQGFHGRSWSLLLRPDVAIWSPSGPSHGLHFLDAKFKLVGSLDGDDAQGKAQPGDLHKMHAYKDAIPEARSAWVMFPGTESRHWQPNEGEGLRGVGAVPVVPGEEHAALRTLVERILGAVSSETSAEAA
jgi:predicted component of viral defense system (DUF524 family)